MSKKKKIGRNDKCPCGSGKKYKKCHLPMDSNSTHHLTHEDTQQFQLIPPSTPPALPVRLSCVLPFRHCFMMNTGEALGRSIPHAHHEIFTIAESCSV
ncbi:hypothetical protein COV83_00230 [Candidatus Peregrinibacteria bacterium CG11_big_fil_rev_8_21_14_0_20_49_14]|nr:MAG: hypothetical protein COV83_00230 [Candidatus Peregrinibacteria bacterium CG11_big_fil_rev_8_21_14_0_20_49_14]